MSAMTRRLAMLEQGFWPTPLNGKRPFLSDWTAIEADGETIKFWDRDRPKETNTGLLTKTAPVIDIDILDSKAVEAIADLVRQRFSDKGRLLHRVGKQPKCAFLFRTDEPFDKMFFGLWAPGEPRPKELKDCKHRIEVLGDGQQIVVDGIHPDTNLPYAWTGGEPWTVRRDDLPLLHSAEANAFMADAKKLLIDLGWGVFETKDRPSCKTRWRRKPTKHSSRS
jgi:hypothetical protein